MPSVHSAATVLTHLDFRKSPMKAIRSAACDASGEKNPEIRIDLPQRLIP
jgi:hypothetical protein